MNSQRENGNKKLLCEFCQKEFSCISTKNRHLKNFHNETPENSRRQYIRCPLCSKEEIEPFGTYENLTKHLEQFHDISINEATLYFRNLIEFETWRGMENREVDYVCYRRNKGCNGEEHIYYYCNRSNIKGFVSSCEKRRIKRGGSILISGACPSKITVRICKDGLVIVKYVETHVGHNDELRTKRLSKVQQEYIVGQLAAGITKDRVLENSRIITNGKLERLNLIKPADLAYLNRKFKIDEPTTSQSNCHKELNPYIEEKEVGQTSNQSFDENKILLAEIDDFARLTSTLDKESSKELLGQFRKFRNNWQQRNANTRRKRKIEKQLYPNKK